MSPINGLPPKDWRDLQNQVNQLFQECGLESETDKTIRTVRGTVSVDVFAEDPSTKPTSTYLCECKHWQSAVPKSIVHAFRTVVNDYGANWGLIISSAGFQSGAHEAAANSNVRLLTWDAFQKTFEDRWIQNYMKPRLWKEIDALVEYTEPFNSRISRKAEKLDRPTSERFIQLREKYAFLAFLAVTFYVPLPEGIMKSKRPDLPLRKAIPSDKNRLETNLPEELLDAACLRDFLDLICKHAREGIAAFDVVFGERA